MLALGKKLVFKKRILCLKKTIPFKDLKKDDLETDLPKDHNAPIYYMEDYRYLKTPSLENEKIDQALKNQLKEDEELKKEPIIIKKYPQVQIQATRSNPSISPWLSGGAVLSLFSLILIFASSTGNKSSEPQVATSSKSLETKNRQISNKDSKIIYVDLK